MPTNNGMDARKMPTAPRSPTHDMNSFSRQENRNGARQTITAAGRAKNMSVAATSSAGTSVAGSRSGQTRRPSRTNITIWESQVTASRNTMTVLCARVGRLPTTRPASVANTATESPTVSETLVP